MGDLSRKVNVLAGTRSHFGFSAGNTLPLAATPFGHTHWSIQTDHHSSWFFHPDHHKFQGFRATHQPSPWMGDWGQIVFMPFVGEIPRLDPDGRASAYHLMRPSPYRLAVELVRYGFVFSLDANRTGASLSWMMSGRTAVPFPEAPCFLIEGFTECKIEGNDILVSSTNSSGSTPPNFATYFVFRFPKDDVLEVVSEDHQRLVVRVIGEKSIVIAVAEVGVSFISFDQAKRNVRDWETEADTESGDLLVPQAWKLIFDQFSLTGPEEEISKFATCLYRANLFPRETHEYDHSGNPVHYSFFNGEVLPGEAVTDNGFWDTYRTVYPWFNLFQPEVSSRAIRGWIEAFKEGGWFPQWASPGYRACMVGTHIDAVIADAVVKRVEGFDARLALQGMEKHASQPGDEHGAYGRLGIQDYLELGYVAEETVEGSVARSLDYAYDDWCLAQVQRHLNEDSSKALARSQNYKRLFDPAVGFMRARHKDGSWSHFREFEWGGPYVEGGPWQSSWAVQHDPDGLAELFGGEEAFLTKLSQIVTTPPKFEHGHYGFEIHEMTEMAMANFGQYAHSNQPVHHVLYFFMLADNPKWHEFGREWIGKVLRELYTLDSFPGDEDNGEMACWYLFSSLGFYPFCPGRPEYIAGGTLFDSVKIQLPNGKVLTVIGDDQIALPILNGVSLKTNKLNHFELINGGELRLPKLSF